MGIWEKTHASGKASKESKGTRENAKRTSEGSDKAPESGENFDAGDKETGKAGTNCEC